ncbi:bifunctional oligoribonuclease/PAP phosphatase NrnA [soil metagenome]
MKDRETLDRLAAAISSADHLTMACHVGPDGDALGSMLALAAAAESAGIETSPSFGSPFELPEQFRFLPLDLLVEPEKVPPEPGVMVCFDAGSPDRLGELGGPASRASTLVVIDHHVTNAGFGDVTLIDPTASSTAELTMTVIRHLRWPITPVVATALLTGIITDTGRFQYSNTSPRTLEAAAQLVAAGARPEVVGRHVYEETPFGYLKVVAAVTARAELLAERRFVWSVVEPIDLEGAGIGKGDVDGLIDLIRLPRESDVAALFKVVDGSTVKGSLRSRGRVDVGSIAAELGGGGHHNAAGFTFGGTVAAAVDAVVGRLPAGDVGDV